MNDFMKKFFLQFITMLCLCVMMMPLSSCKDDDEPAMDRDPAATVSGTYIGTGVESITGLGGLGEITYPGMKIQITKSSKEFIILKVYLANGTSYFQSDKGHVYQISQLASGDYKLTNDDYPLAQLTISKSGVLKYSFPYVNGGDYTLSIEATKEY